MAFVKRTNREYTDVSRHGDRDLSGHGDRDLSVSID